MLGLQNYERINLSNLLEKSLLPCFTSSRSRNFRSFKQHQLLGLVLENTQNGRQSHILLQKYDLEIFFLT